MKRLQKYFLVIVILFSLFFLIWTFRRFVGPPDTRVYMSGVLVRGDISGCGLVRVLKVDRLGCRLPEDFCKEYSEYLNERIRISAENVKCRDRMIMRCSSRGDFYDVNFMGADCYEDPAFVKVFKTDFE